MNNIFTELYSGFAITVTYATHDPKEVFPKGTREKLEKLAEDLGNFLPHGSGIDGDWDVTISPEDTDFDGRVYRVVCSNSYHGMANGMYAGWLDFMVTFDLDDELDIITELHNKQLPGREFDTVRWELETPDLEEMIAEDEADDAAAMEAFFGGEPDEDDFPEWEYTGVGWDGVVEYLEQTIDFALSELLKNAAA